jgi:hypothetical protein
VDATDNNSIILDLDSEDDDVSHTSNTAVVNERQSMVIGDSQGVENSVQCMDVN